MSSSDENLERITEKELERRRKKNKKKKESKRNNKKTRSFDLPAAAIDQEEVVELNDESALLEGVDDNSEESEKEKELAQDNDSSPKVKSASRIPNMTVDIEYVGEKPKLDDKDPNYFYFMKVFETFKVKTEEELKREEQSRYVKHEVYEDTLSRAAISEKILQDELSQRRKEAEETGEVQKLSRKKLRIAMQPSIAELKAATIRADVVEWADVTSRDPFMLVELKAYRNTVMVPRHWNAKRKYLAGKRGFERAPFELPEFIKRTGIMEMRETMWEKEEHQSLKSKMREKTRPKLGRIDIDYQKLHDAFFKWQTKPSMTKMGELYYEGKELEAQMRDKKPGQLTDELRIALGMPVGPNSNKFPPPWLIAMQRYGPPPSYPNLKIPGLNCPIPEGCAFGYHAGGWGKPPVDEYGKPIYGDVFGLHIPQVHEIEEEIVVDRRHWGEFASEEEASDDESEEEDDDLGTESIAPPESGFVTPANTEGFVTPSGITTNPGIETPATSIEIRKKKVTDESFSGADTPAALYSILPEKRSERIPGQVMGTTHVYDLSSQRKTIPTEGIELSINPEDLDLDPSKIERKVEDLLRKKAINKMDNEEDFSDMVAEHSAKQNRKRKAQEEKKAGSSSSSSSKKYKDFKF